MLRESIIRRLEDTIRDIFIELETELRLEPEIENIYFSVERAQIVEQLATNMVNTIVTDTKKGE